MSLEVALSILSVQAGNPVIRVSGGLIQGVSSKSGKALVYKGVPYAAPPIGELRWKKPTPVQPWNGVRLCDTFGHASLQGGQSSGSFYWREFYQDGEPTKSEDCLYLNVWTPINSKANATLPVMVWIHGGAFMNGFGHEIEFDGDAFARKGVILVTVNYRLGMCGFLSHPLLTLENKGVGSGNYGLYDQLAALHWVHDNIRHFGGNPENVTLFGQSAGAGSVQTLISSPLIKGLVHRAIIQSGGGLDGIIKAKSQKEAEQEGENMWKSVGISTLEQMRNYPSDKFQLLIDSYRQQQKTFGLPFSPVVDGELLLDDLGSIARRGDELSIPYMIGYVADDLAPEIMRQAAINWSLLLEKQNRQPAYLYVFRRDLPEGNNPLSVTGDMPGAFHSSELWYVFGTLDRCWRPMTKADYALSEQMIAYWTNFAKFGNPNGRKLPLWTPYTANNKYIKTFDIK